MLAYSKERKPETQLCQVNQICKEGINVDPQGIHRCLLNLLTNAVDAVEEDDGEVRISTHYQEENGMLITVEDNGSGIPEQISQRIFDVFFSTKGSQGTGLGLAVTKKIIEEHGGRIEVQSIPDQGTTFTIQLPTGKAAES
jgi:signal transduction histidine kinase